MKKITMLSQKQSQKSQKKNTLISHKNKHKQDKKHIQKWIEIYITTKTLQGFRIHLKLIDYPNISLTHIKNLFYAEDVFTRINEHHSNIRENNPIKEYNINHIAEEENPWNTKHTPYGYLTTLKTEICYIINNDLIHFSCIHENNLHTEHYTINARNITYPKALLHTLLTEGILTSKNLTEHEKIKIIKDIPTQNIQPLFNFILKKHNFPLHDYIKKILNAETTENASLTSINTDELCHETL